ncbi:MAG TPA: response regulator transcription factor [Actinophytocola sp.]|jgi:DNA-binding NarL/FixJ family response regulator|nr:response regulator transcription factor [Actinophytocola sp.]
MDHTGAGIGEHAGVLLYDNHWITKTALRNALTGVDGLRIAAETGDLDEVGTAVSGRPAPDVIVFTEAKDPTIVLSRVTEVAPDWPVKVVMVGGQGIPAELAVRCASVGSLPWTAGEQEFVSAVRLVAAGHSVIARHRDDGSGMRQPGRLEAVRGEYALTTRECDVLLLVAKGFTNAEISAGLGLGESTVKSHVQNVLNKLGARNRVSAAIYAYEVGLMRPNGSVRFSA